MILTILRVIDHFLGYLSVVIIKCEGRNRFSFVGGKGKAARDIWFKADCTAGKYVAIVSTLWKKENYNVNETGDNTRNSFSFWSYGVEALRIQRITSKKNLKRCQQILELGLKNYVSGSKDSQKFQNLLILNFLPQNRANSAQK